MRISPVRLPRLLGVVVIAFAQFEDRPLLGAVELFRGLAIQLAYRWATGRIVADPDDRAVLLWSEPLDWEGRSLARELIGVFTATVVGIVMLVVTSALLVVPLGVVLLLAGVDRKWVTGIGLSVIVLRWLLTCRRAIGSYRNEQALASCLPMAKSVRWQIDYLAAIPARSGYGGHLLDMFVHRADQCGAEVVLHCDDRNVPFYCRHGFYDASPRHSGDQRVMRRECRASGVLAEGQSPYHSRRVATH